MSDFEIDERPCPKCGHPYTHWRECTEIGCDEGYIDRYDGDPINYSEGALYERCQTCRGQGHLRWCPSCGADLWD
jgi:predicted RNA-binding Zn-ribbon protein involved in translation (DUF1610 family)